MLTNWNTIQNSIKRLKKLEDQLSKENWLYKGNFKIWKKKRNQKISWWNCWNEKTPDLIFIIDTNIEFTCCGRSKKLSIPIIGILDTNSDPTESDFPIPGNDDARRSINLYCDLLKNTIKDVEKFIRIGWKRKNPKEDRNKKPTKK